MTPEQKAITDRFKAAITEMLAVGKELDDAGITVIWSANEGKLAKFEVRVAVKEGSGLRSN